MDLIMSLTVNGLATGMLIFLVAIGLTFTFGLMGVLNFAHGAVFSWGAYTGYWFFTTSGSFTVGLIGAILTGTLLGCLVGKYILEPVHGKPLQEILITMGLMIVLSELLKAVFSLNTYRYIPPVLLAGSFELGGILLIKYRIFVIAFGILILTAMHYLLKKTRIGLIVRAGVINKEMVQVFGINIKRVFLYVFMLGSGLAALSGALLGPYFGILTPDVGMQFQILGFMVVGMGGMGNVRRTALASIILGLVNVYVSYLVPSFEIFINLFIIVIIFLVRLRGLHTVRG
ncbi:MAG: branched-chain amino acid ABC transporter permease [Firmicutes bacterium HGW-Firmicutes-14]|nr:MAG: branched-chain amino acid ABC transporter permease [Firmicutes bacterium HGW-Firmicutes-14]